MVEKELLEHMAYLFFSRGAKLSTIAGKLVVVEFLHRQVGVELSMQHHLVWSVKAGLAEENAFCKAGAGQAHLLGSWAMLKNIIGTAKKWGEGGRILWLTFAVS